MSSKTATLSNGTLKEAQPESGIQAIENDGSATQIENLEGVAAHAPGQGDIEVYNTASSENAELLEETEQSGQETSESDVALRDAYYASYPEAPSNSTQEVIIGADDRVRINPTTSYPWRAICALKITAKDGSKWIGTGWFVSPRTIITAGHVVYMHNQGGWAKSIEVIPGQNDASQPFGSGVATTFRSVTGWTTGGPNADFDYGAIILPANKPLGNATGWFGLSVRNDSFLKSAILNLSGYPGDKGGKQQWFMSKKTKSVSSRRITYEIDTMGGQSGSPVWILIDGKRYAVGVHTNGHSSGNSATRLVTPVYNNLVAWKNLGL